MFTFSGATIKGAQGQQIIMVSSAGGLKQISGTPTMSQAAGNSGVKMIVVSSGQLAQTTSKPITISMPGGQKTVNLSAGAKGGQIVQTSSGQILQLPAGGLMSGGKPVTVQMASGGQKTLTLVQAPKAEPRDTQDADPAGNETNFPDKFRPRSGFALNRPFSDIFLNLFLMFV